MNRESRVRVIEPEPDDEDLSSKIVFLCHLCDQQILTTPFLLLKKQTLSTNGVQVQQYSQFQRYTLAQVEV